MSSDSHSAEAAPSKSELKRQARARLELGRKLVELPPSELARVPLPDSVLDAVKAAQRITQRIARKREIQYLGKLLRAIDVEPIRDAMDMLRDSGRVETARHHRLERWRDALIDRGDALLHALCRESRSVDRQRVRRLIIQAKREATRDAPPAASRELFRALREFDDLEPLPDEVLRDQCD